MAAPATVSRIERNTTPRLTGVEKLSGVRVLCWNGGDLFASRGYDLLRATPDGRLGILKWKQVGSYSCGPWRNLTSSMRLTSRLFRDGFHALAVSSSGHIVGAIPGCIVTLHPGEMNFSVSHRLLRGTRPLHIATGKDDHFFWGEYFDNPQRDEVHIFGSSDCGQHWEPVYTFAAGTIRHIHNIVFDSWADCYWVLTGDSGDECQILRASLDFRTVDVVMIGSQQTRSAALIPTRDALYFSSDTPLEQNHIFRLDRDGELATVATIRGSSLYGCWVGESLFFSTMVEPSQENPERDVCVYASSDGETWKQILSWRKDRWPMGLFQYGNASLPDGLNPTCLFPVTTTAVEGDDLVTSVFRLEMQICK